MHGEIFVIQGSVNDLENVVRYTNVIQDQEPASSSAYDPVEISIICQATAESQGSMEGFLMFVL